MKTLIAICVSLFLVASSMSSAFAFRDGVFDSTVPLLPPPPSALCICRFPINSFSAPELAVDCSFMH